MKCAKCRANHAHDERCRPLPVRREPKPKTEAADDGPMSHGTLAYLERRLALRLYDLIVGEFSRLEAAGQIMRASLAKKVRKDKSQITRILGGEANWTIGTISALLGAMGTEIGPLTLRAAPDPDQQGRLLAIASHAITATLAEGKAKYAPGNWLTVDAFDHAAHGADHAVKAMDIIHYAAPQPHDAVLELRHAICRAVMCLARLEGE